MNVAALNRPDIRDESSTIAAYEFAAKAVTGLEKLVELNVQTVKTSLSEQQALIEATLFSASFSTVIELQLQQFPAAVKKISAYWGHVEIIAEETGSELLDVVQESVQNYLATQFSLFDSAASIGIAPIDRTNAASPITVEQSPVATKEPVVLVDSSGNVVLSGRGSSGLH
ncbi:phasin family protein [Paraburkholderia sp. MPAMCS5]|uniref:phasin family protein n=1 Tax=Paraburkholderia sp. MPAMCS5 TaxID=3112563 RepID=UPI002E19A409|nr:phasin family protein [Paraburkholderia sp. MPAMCS5]